MTDLPIWVIHHPPYAMFIEAPTLEEAEAMNQFRNSKAHKKRSDSESILSDADVRAILASSGTYSELAKLFKVSVTTIPKVKNRLVRGNVEFDGEVVVSIDRRGRKPKGQFALTSPVGLLTDPAAPEIRAAAASATGEGNVKAGVALRRCTERSWVGYRSRPPGSLGGAPTARPSRTSQTCRQPRTNSAASCTSPGSGSATASRQAPRIAGSTPPTAATSRPTIWRCPAGHLRRPLLPFLGAGEATGPGSGFGSGAGSSATRSCGSGAGRVIDSSTGLSVVSSRLYPGGGTGPISGSSTTCMVPDCPVAGSSTFS